MICRTPSTWSPNSSPTNIRENNVVREKNWIKFEFGAILIGKEIYFTVNFESSYLKLKIFFRIQSRRENQGWFSYFQTALNGNISRWYILYESSRTTQYKVFISLRTEKQKFELWNIYLSFDKLCWNDEMHFKVGHAVISMY